MATRHKPEVAACAEWTRIDSLPERTYSDEEIRRLVRTMTARFLLPGQTGELRPVQAIALHEATLQGGLFGPMRVGAGKTLTSFLLPRALNARNPVLIVPAALMQKTISEMRKAMCVWDIPTNIRVLSYEMLGREKGADVLANTYKPDLIVCDETHKLKNSKAGVTRRLTRYMRNFPETRFAGISGTIMRKKISEFAHIMTWALKDQAPVPSSWGVLSQWADALDENVNPFQRADPGALLNWATAEEIQQNEPTAAARLGFRRRMCSTPGVVSSDEDSVNCALYITGHEYKVNAATEANFTHLRSTWQTPDLWQLAEAVDVWRHARELALGLHYVWSPRPPDEWRAARSAWASYVRGVLAESRTLDTELQVRKAVRNGDIPGRAEWDRWDRVRDTFTPNTLAVWHDDSATEWCERWMAQGPGIVWTEHSLFARRLAKRTGARYFGQGAVDSTGLPVGEANPKDGPIICSVAACGTGQNLQAWNRNLVTACSGGSSTWEQLIGRTHRPGQLADEVSFDVLLGCREHATAWESALLGARSAQELLGQSQKLLIADLTFPSLDLLVSQPGPRWVKVIKTDIGKELSSWVDSMA